ncbi:hypothetical protein DHD32_21090 [Arenibacter sp. TNZ]|nr:hypothetical protein [Arenibacter sp. TNZ]
MKWNRTLKRTTIYGHRHSSSFGSFIRPINDTILEKGTVPKKVPITELSKTRILLLYSEDYRKRGTTYTKK